MKDTVTKDRNLYIGGSDIPIIMGLSQFKNRFELAQEKAGIIKDEFEGNSYTEYGNQMEPKIREYINFIEADNFVPDCIYDDYSRCNTDGYSKNRILEIKTTSQLHPTIDGYKTYLVQLLYYIHEYIKINKIEESKAEGILAVYYRPTDFNIEFDENRLAVYKLKYTDYKALVNQILLAVEIFRNDVDRLKENPFLSEEDLMPKELINVCNEVIRFENQLESYKYIQKQFEEQKEKLYKLMDKYAIKKWIMFNGTKVTRVQETEDTEVEKFDEKKFKKENESLYNSYLTKTIKKGRKGYVLITQPKDYYESN